MRDDLTPSPGTAESHGSTTPVPSTMRAIVHEAYGHSDVLHLATIPTPRAGDHDVLVRVAAAGLDRGAWHAMTGLPYLGRLYFGPRRPKNPVLGTEVAGTVVAIGAAVTTVAVGDEVFGFGRGSFAEYALVAEDRLAPKPGSLSFAEAATLPVSAVTALLAVHDKGEVTAGQKVLVTGASGGVGSYAVQLAKAAGAHVTGVCSPAKADLVRSFGADVVLDRTREDFADGSRQYDLIIDVAGNPSLARLRRALKPRGTAVLTGGEQGGALTGGMSRQLGALALSPFIGQRLTMFVASVRTSDLDRLATLVDDGVLRPSLQGTYPLDRAPEAMRRLEAGEARGKVAIVV